MKDLYDQAFNEKPENMDQLSSQEIMVLQDRRPLRVPSQIKVATSEHNQFERILIWLINSCLDSQDKTVKESAKIYSLLWDYPMTLSELNEKLEIDHVDVFGALAELSKLGFLSVFSSNGNPFVSEREVYFSTNFIKYRNLITTFFNNEADSYK